MFDVISVGSATQDVFVRTELSKIVTTRDVMNSHSLLAFDYGAKVNVDEVTFCTGGGGTNTAVAFARLGLRSAFFGKVGCDEAGDAVLAELEREGVDTSFAVRSTEHATGYSVVLNSFEGDRTILVYRGANSHITFRDVDLDKFKNTRWMYISSLSGTAAELLDDFAFFSEEHGINLALNPGSTQIQMGLKGMAKILSVVEILFLNKEEASRLTGIQWSRRVVDYERCTLCGACVEVCPYGLWSIVDGRVVLGDERKCRRTGYCIRACVPRAIRMEPWASNLDPIMLALKALGPKIVVVTDGNQGAQAYDGETLYYMPPYSVPAVDTLGAGDAFGAAFTAAFILGHDLPTCLKWGCANGASVVTHYGAKPGQLTRQALEEFIAAEERREVSVRQRKIDEDEAARIAAAGQ